MEIRLADSKDKQKIILSISSNPTSSSRMRGTACFSSINFADILDQTILMYEKFYFMH